MAEHGDTKTCRDCAADFPLSNFRTNFHVRKDGTRHVYPRPVCRSCDNAIQRRRYDPLVGRSYSLKTRYGITETRFQAMLAEQGGCAACGSPTTDGKYWHVDHDHSCCDGRRSCGNCLRAILCHGCNTALGNVGDDKGRLAKLITYLERFE